MRQADIDKARILVNEKLEEAIENIADEMPMDFGAWPDDCGAMTDVVMAVLIHQARVNQYRDENDD